MQSDLDYSFNEMNGWTQPAADRSYGRGERAAFNSRPFQNYKMTIVEGDGDPQEIDLGSFHKQELTFGRDQDNDIQIESMIVSARHGMLSWIDGSIVVSDERSTNGILYHDRYVDQCRLMDGDILRIDIKGGRSSKGIMLLFNAGSRKAVWKAFPLTNRDRLRIGRSQENTITLSNPMVSRNHAELLLQPQGALIRDFNSTNGTYVNGIRVNGVSGIKDRDVIQIANTIFIYSRGCLYYYSHAAGIGIKAQHLIRTVMVKDKKKLFGKKSRTICNDVSLEIRPGELAAIIGGSGAGKTTLMNAICGYEHPTSGRVLVSGIDLYRNYDAMKGIIGYVPQRDIVYDNLTLEDMLDYTARLRLPDDTSPSERKERIRKVIRDVELEGKENQLIREFSGGQKKRASIAVELLADPTLFFLDEPASGLDPGTERNLMKTLRKMADSGKTVILVTHSTLNLQVCDKIVFMGRDGNLCYCGSYYEAEDFFGIDNLVDVYNMMTENPEFWRDKYRQTAYEEALNDGPEDKSPVRSHRKRKSFLRQTVVLSSRYMHLILNDTQRLLMLLLQAPLLAWLVSLVSDGNQFEYYGITKSLLFALSCCAFWIGTLNSIQEICKERTILHREYMTGLSMSCYIISKYLVLGILCLAQSALLGLVFAKTVGLPEEGLVLTPFAEVFLTTFLTSYSAASMGLFVSALFKNQDRAMTVAPILLLPQILFSGLLFKLEGITKIISWAAICRWSNEAYGTAANLNALQYMVEIGGEMTEIAHEAEDFFDYTVPHLLKDWMILLAFILLFAMIARIAINNIRKESR